MRRGGSLVEEAAGARRLKPDRTVRYQVNGLAYLRVELDEDGVVQVIRMTNRAIMLNAHLSRRAPFIWRPTRSIDEILGHLEIVAYDPTVTRCIGFKAWAVQRPTDLP